MIHLKHKEHGYHICYTEAEAKIAEKQGWKRCDMDKEHAAARAAKAKAAKEVEDARIAGEKAVKKAKES